MPFPRAWTDTLDKLRAAGGSDAVIAGGAVRDHLLGREVKDIDVFLRSRGKDVDRAIVLAAFPEATCLAQHLDEYLPQFQELSSIWEATGESDVLFWPDVTDEPPKQIMFLNSTHDMTPHYVVHRIDIGLCRVAFDGAKIIADDGFFDDLLTQTMTVRRQQSPENHERSCKRFTRLSAKYPSYTFSTPYNRTATPMDPLGDGSFRGPDGAA